MHYFSYHRTKIHTIQNIICALTMAIMFAFNKKCYDWDVIEDLDSAGRLPLLDNLKQIIRTFNIMNL